MTTITATVEDNGKALHIVAERDGRHDSVTLRLPAEDGGIEIVCAVLHDHLAGVPLVNIVSAAHECLEAKGA